MRQTIVWLRRSAMVGMVALLAAACASPSAVDRAEAGESVLSVACSPKGISVSGEVVQARASGITLAVSSSMAEGAYLNYQWPGGGGGDPLPAEDATWTLLAPPGALDLFCTRDGDPIPKAKQLVTVTDPEGYWNSASLKTLGCERFGVWDWGGTPGSGESPEAAVNDLVPGLSTQELDYAISKAPIGYPDASPEIWIASVGSEPRYVISVLPDGDSFEARPEGSCAA